MKLFIKRVALLILGLLILLSVACTPKLESKLNETNTLIAKRAITAVDKYLDGDPDWKSAKDAVDRERNKIDEDDEKIHWFSLSSDLLIISTTFTGFYTKGEDVAKIRAKRNDIAELAGIPKR